jgi:(p)ppGpp synthase/HD superfamily hydrolase
MQRKQNDRTPTLADAILLAAEAHREQLRKNGEAHILHPLRVMFRLEIDVEKMVGVLHDVVEDTAVTMDELRTRGYPDQVLQALDCVTKRKDESYEDFVERSKTNSIARRVKLADLEDNMDVKSLPKPLTQEDMDRLSKYRKAYTALQSNNVERYESPPRQSPRQSL